MNRLEACFDQLRAQGQRALIAYVCAGDPNLEATFDLVKGLVSAGADIIELGVPFSDPVADGPVIQAAGQRALAAGTTLRQVLDLARRLRTDAQVEAPLVLMSYYNPILGYGLEAFSRDLAAAGDGVIVPDLPVEESEPLRQALEAQAEQSQGNGIACALIPLVAPTTTPQRLRRIVAGAQGFIYCVSVTGVTGSRQSLPPDLDTYITNVRRATVGEGSAEPSRPYGLPRTGVPIAVGFGVGTPEQARQVAGLAGGTVDGVIVGSALVEAHARGGVEAAVSLTRSLRQALDASGGGSCACC